MKKAIVLMLVALLAISVVVAAMYKKLGDIKETGKIELTAKDPATWEPVPGASGYVKYGLVGNGKVDLEVYVCGDKLKKDMKYQLTLNGYGNTDTDTNLASACAKPNQAADGFVQAWECGNWGSEGFYNFEMGVAPIEKSCGTPKCSWQYFDQKQQGLKCYYDRWKKKWRCIVCNYPNAELCIVGKYEVTLPTDNDGEVYKSKFLVKEAGENPQTYTGPWTAISFETEPMQFVII